MAARYPVHIASEAARREQRRTGHITRCGAPLVDVPFYWDCPTNDDLLEETCPVCIANYRNERKQHAGKKEARRCGAHFGR